MRNVYFDKTENPTLYLEAAGNQLKVYYVIVKLLTGRKRKEILRTHDGSLTDLYCCGTAE